MEISDIKDKGYYYFLTYCSCHDVRMVVFELKEEVEVFVDENMADDFHIESLVFGQLCTIEPTTVQVRYKVQDK